MARGYVRYLTEELNKLDVDTLIKISQYLYDKGITTFKHIKPTDDDIKKYFNIQGDISLVEFLNRILEEISNYNSFKSICSCIGRLDAFFIDKSGSVFFECKDDMIFDLIDIIFRNKDLEGTDKDQTVLSCINDNFNFNIKLKSEYEKKHKRRKKIKCQNTM